MLKKLDHFWNGNPDITANPVNNIKAKRKFGKVGWWSLFLGI